MYATQYYVAIATKAGFFLLLLGFLDIFNLLVLALFRGRRGGVASASVLS